MDDQSKIDVQSSILFKDRSEIRKKKKLKKPKKEKHVVSKIVEVSPFDIPGVTKIALSPISQKIVGCIVGDDVTAESPWKYIKKEVIEDNIELHEDSSEFLPIKKEIIEYPEAEILLGFTTGVQADDRSEFYVVHTTEARENVLKIIEQQHEQLQLRLHRSVWRPVGRWESLGSETEINENLIQNFRPLYEIELQSKFPLTDTKVNFKMRKVEDAVDGYVELLPDIRYPITNVERKRIDAGVQAAPDKVSNEAQTTPTYPTNIWTQYEYQYEEKVISEACNKDMQKFMSENIEKLDDTIRVNENINMYEDDYASLLKDGAVRLKVTGKVHTFLSYSDVQSCKGKLIGDCSWSSFISGIVAVCYTDMITNALSHGKSVTDDVSEAVHGCCPVIIWSYTDDLHPKLYLEAPRQVTYLSFCPYVPDILIGGCINGQIIIWDISGKLEQVETVEVLTASQKRNRLTILTMMDWMKNTRNVAEVQPTIISSLQYSHKDAVTSISWLPPDLEITPTGKYLKILDPNRKSKQFLTYSLDGTVLAWDVDLKPGAEVSVRPQRKGKRLKQRPSALTLDVSQFKAFSKTFKPHYKLIVSENAKPFPIVSTLRKTRYMKYDTDDTSCKDDPAVRTKYRLSKHQKESDSIPLLLASTTGRMIKISWEGFDFNSGQLLNSEVCSTSNYQIIHDGPIVSCTGHPLIEDCVLTVGGKIFALWRYGADQPLLWRRLKTCKYMCGGFTTDHPAYVILIRSDGAIEIWDFLISNREPSKIIHLGGDMIMNLLGTLTSPHSRKNTFAATDNLGTLTIYNVPDILLLHSKDEVIMCELLFNRSFRRREEMIEWTKKFREQHKPVSETTDKNLEGIKEKEKKKEDKEEPKKEVEKKISEIERMDRIFTGIQWNSLQEKVMYDTMLKKKKLNLTELEEQKQPLQKIAFEKRKRQEKQQEILENKPKIFESARAQLFQEIKTLRQRHYSLEHVIDEASLAYLAEYEEIQQRALNYVKSNEFVRTFDWCNVLEEGKARRKKIETVLNYINIHNRYNDRKLLKQKMEPRATEVTVTSSAVSVPKENIEKE